MTMQLKEFAQLVLVMRRKQSEYKETRNLLVRNIMTDYERRVDVAVGEILAPPGLFDTERPQ